MSFRRGITLLIIALSAAAGAPTASAAVGDLGYRVCLTGNTTVAPCASTPGATADGQGSGLESPRGGEVSPDGRSLYVASRGDDAVAHFRRNRKTRELTYRGCLSGETASAAACSQVPGAAPDGEGSGLDGADHIAISPDGRSLYVAARTDDAVAHFRRNRKTGVLTFVGCVSGNDQATSCTKIPTATGNGNDSGLSAIDSVEVSLDGGSVYGVTSDAAVARLSRAGNGALTYRGCIGADTDEPCRELPGAVPGGSDTGFSSLRALALSPDGRSLYTVSDSDEAVGEFRLAQGNGALSYRRCLTGATSISNCRKIPGATPNGDATGLRSTVHVTVSPDGNSVYTVADDDNAVAHFDRAASGALEFRDCLSGDINATGCRKVPGAGPGGGSNSGMNAAVWGEVAPDGRSVYVAASSDSAISLFRRNPKTGALAALGCLSAKTEATPCRELPTAVPGGEGTGLYRVRSFALSPDGRSLYSVSNDDAVARFDREPDRAGPKLGLRLRKRQSGRRVIVRVNCRNEFCSRIIGRGALRAGGRRAKLKKVTTVEVSPGRREKLVLKLSGRAKKILKRSGRGKAKVSLVGRDLLGNRTKRSAGVLLRP